MPGIYWNEAYLLRDARKHTCQGGHALNLICCSGSYLCTCVCVCVRVCCCSSAHRRVRLERVGKGEQPQAGSKYVCVCGWVPCHHLMEFGLRLNSFMGCALSVVMPLQAPGGRAACTAGCAYGIIECSLSPA